MAILGFIILVLFGLYLAIAAYATACMELGFGGGPPKISTCLLLAALFVFWLAYYFAPFSIRMVPA